jgi:cell division protein FtsI/penicillin-binding protein 2
MTEALVHSDNVAMVFVAQRLGKEAFVKKIKEFGFGQKTGIDLQEEVSGDLRQQWNEVDLAVGAFGQGLAVTGMQMVKAVGAIANGGKLMEPQVVYRVIGDKEVVIKPKVVGQAVSPETAEVIKEMMVAAVEEGEAKWAAPKGYRIAGKTGTSQIPIAGHYDTDKTIASFVGFAPADNPRFVMLTKLREPQTSPWGSETAAPLFFRIAKDLLLYWGIPPSP